MHVLIKLSLELAFSKLHIRGSSFKGISSILSLTTKQQATVQMSPRSVLGLNRVSKTKCGVELSCFQLVSDHATLLDHAMGKPRLILVP